MVYQPTTGGSSNLPNMSDTRWWALQLENIVQAPINTIGGWLGRGTSWGTDWTSNEEINEQIDVAEQREKALGEYYKNKQKSVDDFKRWSENNPEKREYGDYIDGQNIKDTAMNLFTDNASQDGLIKAGVFGLFIIFLLQIFK